MNRAIPGLTMFAIGGVCTLTAFVVGGAFAQWATNNRPHASGDLRIASTSFAEVCATDGQPGSAYSRAHRVVQRHGVPGKIQDHVLPICAGGADVDANIQLQDYDEARRKDDLEREVCIAVCRDRRMTLAEGQAIFLSGAWRDRLR